MITLPALSPLLFAGALLAYLLGSIPFGLVLTRLAGLGDIRTIGSGNIGATNVLRTGRKDLALATLLLDGGKGAVAVLLARWLAPDLIMVAAVASILGHLFPVWLSFKGGKGVATTLGAWIALSPVVGIAACLTWLLIAALFRISSLSALVAITFAPAYAWFAGQQGWSLPGLWLPGIALAAMVIYRHHANIARLLKGEEPRIGKKK